MSQPPCGGKQPRLYEFLDIETDDPEAFVREREPGVELEMGSSIGKQVYFVLNKVDAEKEKMMRELIKNPDRIIAAVPSSQEILECDRLLDRIFTSDFSVY